MIRKLSNLALIIALAFTVALAQQPRRSTTSVDRLRQVIAYLASDALEGRRTGTPGANDAAHYIAVNSSLWACGRVCRLPGRRARAAKPSHATCNRFLTWPASNSQQQLIFRESR